jgi:tetratricopeptide (TPR) repeat protein
VWGLFQREEWEKARKVLLQRLKDEPDDHWLITRIGTTYYEERDYEKALEYHETAMRLAPRCPLVLWDYAGTISMLGREKEAIGIWKRLIRRGVREIAYGRCGEGIRRARELTNDCRYTIGAAYASLGRSDLAKRYLRAHIAHRGPNCGSVYDLRQLSICGNIGD